MNFDIFDNFESDNIETHCLVYISFIETICLLICFEFPSIY